MEKLLNELIHVCFRRQKCLDTYNELKRLQKIPDNNNDESFPLATPEIETNVLNAWKGKVGEYDIEIDNIKKQILGGNA